MSKIARIWLDEVVIPARPGSINSPETDHALHKLPVGAKRGWSQQFDTIAKIIIRLELDNGIVGLGETYRGIPMALAQEIAQSLIGIELGSLCLQDLPLPQGRVYDGFECAITDAFARCHDLPLHALLGGKRRDKIKTAYWTGHRTTSDAVRLAGQAQEMGYDCIKFKCKLGDPVVTWCAEIHGRCGDDFRIVLDPNERFDDAVAAGRLADGLADIGNVLYLEDPIARWDMEEWRHLRGKSRVPLAMHISLPYVEMGQIAQDMARALRLGACDYFNFNGGIFAIHRLNQTADLFNVKYSHGSELDFGILEASYVHKCAAGALNHLPSDIFGRLIRQHDLLVHPLYFDQGWVSVPEGPGLGVELDQDALAHYSRFAWNSET